MDALRIRKAVLGGFDWGSRTAGAVAALWPERCQAVVLVSGYLITNLKAQLQPLAPAAELGWWYQYYFSTERGVLGYTQKTDEFTKLIWQTVSPKWYFDDATFQRTAQSFTNPYHVAIVVHNYRRRLSLAPGEPQYDPLEAKLQQSPEIGIPTITIASDFDGAAADGSGYRAQFTGKYERRVLPGIGHNVPQEAPADFTQAIVDADRL
ncbi:alpha/beta fold hydrolase [Amycolatopsis sp. FDAARGOS 1241]|uniref:alpha/beta fold hydrolase n=1 Tax=Amycolatopsis sp. FDAARGOS 1241 TaxID=2778070 RepID=UPI0019502F33|nr:alpha/beta hydrolase [Amycolatopsis sp. FDAARGOS 1241]QRP47128.1 alpha/beta hydrolase [Amycolatopsis sp. FDAARGOS 1241]